MPEWARGSVAGSPDRRSRGRERIPYSILEDEKLWKGERETVAEREGSHLTVWTARSACGGAAGSVARVSVSRGMATRTDR